MLRDIVTVYRKELREVLRDRRTLVFMIMLPLLLVPLLITGVTEFMTDATEKAESQVLQYAVIGTERAPDVAAALGSNPSLQEGTLEAAEGIDAAIREGEVDFVVVATEPSASGQTTLELHYDNAPMLSRVERRVRGIVETLGESRRAEALAALGVDDTEGQEAIVQPLVVRPHGIATEREVLGERMGGMLPYLFIVFCFLGAMYPSIDLGAGEKERGTLETLLLAPISRTALVLGKFLVVFSTGVVSAVLGTLSLGVWVDNVGAQREDAMGHVLSAITPGDLLLMVALVVPVAAVLAAGLLAISIYAKSFKEAQSYATPLNLVVLLPAFVAMLPGVTFTWRWALVPIANVALAIKEIVKGTPEPGLVVLVFASSLALAAAMLAFCVQWFRREGVLFRK